MGTATPDRTAIKTTLAECQQAEVALLEWAQVRLPVKTAYHISKLLRLCRQEIAHFNEFRDTLIKELGEPRAVNEAEAARGVIGPVHEVKMEHQRAFYERLKEYQNLEIVIPWPPLTFEQLEAAEKTTASDLFALGPFMVDEQPAQVAKPVKAEPRPRGSSPRLATSRGAADR